MGTPDNFRSVLGPGAGAITLNWNAVAGATGYEVQQKKVKTAWPDEWKPLPFDSFTVDITGAQAVVGGLQNDKSYHHRVRGVSADGRSEWTTELTTDLAELLKPRGLRGSVKPDGIGEITLQWNAVPLAGRYEVQQKVRDFWPDWFDDWETLPFENVDVTITATKATVENLRYGKDDTNYEHRVRMVNAAGPSEWSSSVRMELPELDALGQQHDHTVRYRIGSMTVAVGPPDGVANPASIVPQAVPTAAAAWNAMMSTHDLLICREGIGNCDTRNSDGHTITVTLMDDSPNNPNANGTCKGGSYACVQSLPPNISGHAGDADIILEEPAWGWGERYRWTLEYSLHGRYIGDHLPDERWAVVGISLVHEFGHTLGIPDLASKYHAGVMSNDHASYPNVADADIDYLRKIYSGHMRGQ